MRCMACDREMILTNVLQDGTSTVRRLERHTFTCSECHSEEQRLVFTKDGREIDAEPTEQVAPQVAPAPTMQNHHLMPSGTLSDPEEPPRTVPLEPTQSVPAELSRPVSVVPEPVETTVPLQTRQTVPADPTQSWSLQQTHTELPAAPAKAWARVLEKLGKRAAAASETERRVQFDRFWESLRSKSARDKPSSTNEA
jgi:hypothetical protein